VWWEGTSSRLPSRGGKKKRKRKKPNCLSSPLGRRKAKPEKRTPFDAFRQMREEREKNEMPLSESADRAGKKAQTIAWRERREERSSSDLSGNAKCKKEKGSEKETASA